MSGRTHNGPTHEWPLVVFTALAIPAAGAIAGRMILTAIGQTPLNAIGYGATIALFAALVVSIAHLGRPLRAPLALRRAGRNPLSTEVVLAAAALALSALEHLPGTPPAIRLAFVLGAGISAVLLLVAIGLVYFLPGRRPWRSALVATPLVCGLAAGMVVFDAAAGVGTPGRGTIPEKLALLFLLLDAIVAAPPWLVHAGVVPRARPVDPALFARRRVFIAARFAMVNLVPVNLLLAGMPSIAAVVFLGGVCVDRLAFYGTACAQTTEAEIAQVEAVIAGRASS